MSVTRFLFPCLLHMAISRTRFFADASAAQRVGSIGTRWISWQGKAALEQHRGSGKCRATKRKKEQKKKPGILAFCRVSIKGLWNTKHVALSSLFSNILLHFDCIELGDAQQQSWHCQMCLQTAAERRAERESGDGALILGSNYYIWKCAWLRT